VMIGSGTEGGSELFKVKYYEREAFLAQSGQLYKQALVPSLGKVWSISPSFRAEKSHTPKHVTEFWQIEMEAAFYGKEEMMECEERLVRLVAERVSESCGGMLKTAIPEFPARFERLSYEKACEEVGLEFGSDLKAEHEHRLCLARQAPFFLTEYPTSEVSFYYKQVEGRPELAHRVDLLGYGEGGWELSSGGVREEKPEKLRERLVAKGMSPESFSWYLEMFRYGFPPHAGFGIGLERLAQTLVGAKNIKEVIPFPRTPETIVP
ncbi:asparagine--tRNA ligase, partial [Candidatus Micrarchaeota archaeon]|nr:asparagine--tRNA ligase [Candidatus Micrarchaeota archaeon]